MSIVRRAQNAIERRVQTSHEEMALQQSRFLARAITWTLLGTTAAGSRRPLARLPPAAALRQAAQ